MAWLAGGAATSFVLARLHSWTGIIGAAAGLGLLALPDCGGQRGFRKHLGPWLLILAFGLGLMVVNPGLGDRLAKLGQEFRFQIWRDALPLLKLYPFGGIGLGAYEKTVPLVSQLDLPPDSRLTHPDSSWVLLAVEWGPLATLLLAGGIAWLLRARDSARPDAGSEDVMILRANQAAVLAWCVCGITDISFHRPETLVPGIALIGTLPWPTRTRLPGARFTGAAAGAACLILVGGWMARATVARGDPAQLRWDPLNPRVQYAAAIAAWNQRGDRTEAVRRFRISTALDSHSARLPATIGQLLAASAPEEAAGFWAEMLRRCRGEAAYGASLLLEAKHRNPELPSDYWASFTAEALPDALLAIAAEDGSDASALLARWCERGDFRAINDPNIAGFFLTALARAPDPGTILDRLMRAPVADIPARVQLQSARLLQAAGDSSRAWSILFALSQGTNLPAKRESLLADPRFRQWVGLLEEAPAVETTGVRLRLLDQVMERVGSPVWFRWERARLLHVLDREHEAVDELLMLLGDLD
jgi:hypothetical protein